MNAAHLFERTFGFASAGTAVASGRVNLLGEHTDYNDGFVLPAAISLATEVAIAPSRDAAFHFVSGNVPGVGACVDFADGTQPAQGYGRYIYGCIEVLRREGAEIGPCCVAVHSTVPIGSGLSSSAALEVAVLRGLLELHELEFDDVKIARMAQRAEIEYAGVQCGIMDQMAASVGKPGQLLFLDTRSLEARLVPFPGGTEIVVLDCGVPRTLAASGYNERRRECEAAAAALGLASLRDVPDIDALELLPIPLRNRARHVVTENQRVLTAAAGVDASRFGSLMVASHRSLRDDFAVSVPALDTLVDCLLQQPEVFGCKLTGAGFGGACVALVAKDSAARVKAAALDTFTRKGYRGSALL